MPRTAIATTVAELSDVLRTLPPQMRVYAISPADGTPWPVIKLHIGHEVRLTGLTPTKEGRVTSENGKVVDP